MLCLSRRRVPHRQDCERAGGRAARLQGRLLTDHPAVAISLQPWVYLASAQLSHDTRPSTSTNSSLHRPISTNRSALQEGHPTKDPEYKGGKY